VTDDELDELLELDYGEGKTRQQDAEDSAALIGFLLVVLAALTAMLAFGWWLFL
jgi:hypothetical protein